MNRSAASATYYPFQVMPRFLFGRQGDVYYIGGSDILPPPLESQREARILEKLGTPEEKEAKSLLIEHNLRLVVYIAKKFDNTGGECGGFDFHWNHRTDQGDQYL